MRRFIPFTLILLLGACATVPQQSPTPQTVAQPQSSNSLVGFTLQQLIVRFGAPALQVREGRSLKLQFRSARCVLDAYLYPVASSGLLTVTHIDTRLPSGNDTDQAACVLALGTRAN